MNTTTRQGQIIVLLLKGHRIASISRELKISHHTVRNHLKKIFKAYDVHTQTELVAKLHRPEGRATLSNQARVMEWGLDVFGPPTFNDREERALRFIEEAIELGQATGLTRDKMVRIIDYVLSRPSGEVFQEVGGVMVTLYSLCNINGIDLEAAAALEGDPCAIVPKRRHYPDFSKECKECQGTGQVYVVKHDVSGFTGHLKEHCPKCEGTGES